MIRSVRVTLTVWYIGILMLILIIFGWAVYSQVAKSWARDIDDALISKVDGIIEAVFAFHEVEKPAPEDQEDEEKFSRLIVQWSDETRVFENIHPIRLFDRTGHFLAASKSFDPIDAKLTEDILQKMSHGKATYQTFDLPSNRFRVLTYPAIEDGKLQYIIQVAAPLEQMDDSLWRLRLWFGWLIPLALASAGAGGLFLARIVLRPVDSMTRQAQKISAEHLSLRIDEPKTGDELSRLATTFNDMLERLDRAFKRLRQFSAAASHELRTPLTVMKGELEIALRKPRSAPEYAETLRAHLETLNEMQATVEQLLTLARSETGKDVIEWSPVELGGLVRQTADALKTVAGKKGVEVEILIKQPVQVYGERNLLSRLISNLLDNAIKHTPSGKGIRIKLNRQGDRASLVVQDEGSGISAEEQAKIFDRFFSNNPSASPGSTGIGLGLCRWIAEVHQGQIDVSSRLGEGASFTVYLPLAHP